MRRNVLYTLVNIVTVTMLNKRHVYRTYSFILAGSLIQCISSDSSLALIIVCHWWERATVPLACLFLDAGKMRILYKWIRVSCK